ncbi:hypothetical protein K525DRAFT_273874 [Schizophyllum commune Loenen D]|nr:hypothetical protein K525DRAFT_273874 [Schizophyllum commune Loenen D]
MSASSYALAPVASNDSANGSRQRTNTTREHAIASEDSGSLARAATYPDASFVTLSSFTPASSADRSTFLSVPSLGGPISIDFPRDATDCDNESTISTEPRSDFDSEDDIQIILDLVTPPPRPAISRLKIADACMDERRNIIGKPYGVVPAQKLYIPSGTVCVRLTKKFYAVSLGYYVGVMNDPADFKSSVDHVSSSRHISAGDLHTVVAWFNAQLDSGLVAIVP